MESKEGCRVLGHLVEYFSEHVIYISGSQTLGTIRIVPKGGLVKPEITCPALRVFDSLGLGWGLGFVFLTSSQSDADAGGLGIILCILLYYIVSNQANPYALSPLG